MDDFFYIDYSGDLQHLNANKEMNVGGQESIDVGDSGAAIAWVASNNLSITTVTWPSKRLSLQKKLSLAPFLLEDAILDDIENVHFAIKDKHSVESAAAVMQKSLMQQWHQSVQHAADNKVLYMLPDILAVPFYYGKWSIWHEGDYTLVRTGMYEGFSGATNWILSVLDISLTGKEEIIVFSKNADALPDKLADYAHSHPNTWYAMLQESAIPIISAGESYSSLNLLQGEFAVKHKSAGMYHYTKIFSGCAVLVLVLHIVSAWVSVANLEQENDALQGRALQIYQSIYPQESTVDVRFRKKMQNYLLELTNISAKRANSSWQVLKSISEFFELCSSCRVLDMQIKERSLDISLLSNTKEPLLERQLKQLDNVNVRWQIRQQEGKYKIMIHLGGA